jgi:hypothetical protein
MLQDKEPVTCSKPIWNTVASVEQLQLNILLVAISVNVPAVFF